MPDTRRKDAQWLFPESNWNIDNAILAVLMDLRDELKAINRVLGCANFLRIPRTIDAIVENTKPRPRKPREANNAGRSGKVEGAARGAARGAATVAAG
jgi:hypothetical protein